MKKLLIITIISGIIFSCASEVKKEATPVSKKKQATKAKVDGPTNLNISVLLDLSDRIDTVKYNNPSMQFYRRDVGYLKSVADAFSNKISHKKLIHLDDKIQLYFDPEPLNPKINDL